MIALKKQKKLESQAVDRVVLFHKTRSNDLRFNDARFKHFSLFICYEQTEAGRTSLHHIKKLRDFNG